MYDEPARLIVPTSPAYTPLDDDTRRELNRLRAEMSALRSQLATLSTVAPSPSITSSSSIETVAASRRGVGRLVQTVLLVAGVTIGALYAAWATADAAGFFGGRGLVLPLAPLRAIAPLPPLPLVPPTPPTPPRATARE